MSFLQPQYINRDLPLTKQERKAIHRAAWHLWRKDKRNFALYLALPAVYLSTVSSVRDLAGWFATLFEVTGLAHKLCRAAAPVALFLLCFFIGGAILQRFRFAPCVYQAMRRRGHDVCPRCGYWLKGLSEDVERCPECGADRPEHALAGV